MAGSVIRARLRKGKDDDIAEAIELALITQDEADILREALRLYFGLDGARVRVSTQPIAKRSHRPIGKAPDLKISAEDNAKNNKNVDDAIDGLLGF